MADLKKLDVLMVGTGEYTTGWVGTGASKSDKSKGVVGLVCFDLRRRGKLGNLSMVGVSGKKFPAIREHLKSAITEVYNGLDTSFESFPADDKVDPEAYKAAIDVLAPGSAIIVFTPDSTHYDITKYALERKLHVMVTKPAVQRLEHHQELVDLAKANGVVCFVEHHKRYDPAYSDAKLKSASLGDFNFWTSYMSQPKFQLQSFAAWAGKDSDISYYLNSHHVDIHAWYVDGKYVPTKVTAAASAGIATADPYNCVEGTEDTISLLVEWQNVFDPSKKGVASYTSSWVAAEKAGVHSEQNFHYLGSKGDIKVDQARRGYTVTPDEKGLTFLNPFYMKYSPDEEGNFDGQKGYGYVSFEKFVDAARAVNAGTLAPDAFDKRGLPTIANTVITTAILDAGRKSLDEKRSVLIKPAGEGKWKLE